MISRIFDDSFRATQSRDSFRARLKNKFIHPDHSSLRLQSFRVIVLRHQFEFDVRVRESNPHPYRQTRGCRAHDRPNQNDAPPHHDDVHLIYSTIFRYVPSYRRFARAARDQYYFHPPRYLTATYYFHSTWGHRSMSNPGLTPAFSAHLQQACRSYAPTLLKKAYDLIVALIFLQRANTH